MLRSLLSQPQGKDQLSRDRRLPGDRFIDRKHGSASQSSPRGSGQVFAQPGRSVVRGFEDWRSVFVFGPEHQSALSKCGVDVPVEGAVSIVGFQVVLQAELAGQGVLLLEPAAGDVDMAKQLIDNGAKELSQTQMHWERIANNTPWCGSEVNDSCLVQEFRRDDKAVSFTKGCYLGQETVARLDALGHVNRYLFGFEVVDGAVAAGDELRKDGKKVGVVSSVADVDSRTAIGLGFVKVELAKPGDELQCENVTLKVRS